MYIVHYQGYKCIMYIAKVTNEILRKVDRDGKLTYTHDKYLFHYIASDMITYLCITDEVRIHMLEYEYKLCNVNTSIQLDFRIICVVYEVTNLNIFFQNKCIDVLKWYYCFVKSKYCHISNMLVKMV